MPLAILEDGLFADPPALVVAEALDGEFRSVKATPRRARDPHAVIAETDNILPAIIVDVRHQTRMLFHTPTPGIIGESIERELRSRETVARRESRPYAVVSKTHDVLSTVTVHVGSRAHVLVIPPALIEAETGHDERSIREEAVRRGQ